MHILFLVFSDLTKSDKATGLEGLVKIIGEDAFLIEYLDPLATSLVYDCHYNETHTHVFFLWRCQSRNFEYATSVRWECFFGYFGFWFQLFDSLVSG